MQNNSIDLVFAITPHFLETAPSKYFWIDRQKDYANQDVLSKMQGSLDSKNCLLVTVSDDTWKDLAQKQIDLIMSFIYAILLVEYWATKVCQIFEWE